MNKEMKGPLPILIYERAPEGITKIQTSVTQKYIKEKLLKSRRA